MFKEITEKDTRLCEPFLSGRHKGNHQNNVKLSFNPDDIKRKIIKNPYRRPE